MLACHVTLCHAMPCQFHGALLLLLFHDQSVTVCYNCCSMSPSPSSFPSSLSSWSSPSIYSTDHATPVPSPIHEPIDNVNDTLLNERLASILESLTAPHKTPYSAEPGSETGEALHSDSGADPGLARWSFFAAILQAYGGMASFTVPIICRPELVYNIGRMMPLCLALPAFMVMLTLLLTCP